MDENTDVSALITPDDCTRVKDWIDEAVAAGADIVTGGNVVEGLLQPTVLRKVTNGMRVMREEVFGPVVGVQTYRDVDEAIRLSNDTDYGLQAGIFTKNLDHALEAARRLEFGGVLVNEVPTWRADQMPYGGVKASGNTKEGPAYTVREMTEQRLVVIQPS
jgi:acyl-CoA reductase-like NAD-dependent aldehyde dehydrogenase